MPTPNLINPILVEIQQVDEDNTVYDSRKREVVNRVKRHASFKIEAQIVFAREEHEREAGGGSSDSRDLAGDVNITDGYIIVRKIDLQMAGKTLKITDKITSYGIPAESCELYLVGKREAGHYKQIGQFTLEKWYFKDRK